MSTTPRGPLLVRHEGHVPRERSTCGWRDRLISREDESLNPAAWVHAVDIDGAKPHYHRRATELYYVLEGEGAVVLDGREQPVRKGTLVHIPACCPLITLVSATPCSSGCFSKNDMGKGRGSFM